MSEKSKAEVLADVLGDPRMVVFFEQRFKAAAELRRLSKVEAQRDALLEALCELLADAEFLGWDTAKARAAIKAVEEGE